MELNKFEFVRECYVIISDLAISLVFHHFGE